MPTLEGSCHCQAVRFTVESDGRTPYMKCYCSICGKAAGSMGPAINLSGDRQRSRSRAKRTSGYGMR